MIEDYIKPMGMSVRALSMALHVPYSRMREIVDGKRGVSADTALRLERYFGSEASGWLALQATYDLRVAQKLNAQFHRQNKTICHTKIRLLLFRTLHRGGITKRKPIFNFS